MQEELIKVKTAQNGFLALWKYSRDFTLEQKHVLLTHGTFSNKKVLNGITEYLVEQDYTCWLFEWRSHGTSSGVKEKFNFESIALLDFPLVFNHLFKKLKIENIHCVMHSGGGICLTMALIQQPHFQKRIQSITMFASQAFGAAQSKTSYYKIGVAKMISRMLGYVPGKAAGGIENESYHMMKQWYNWNLNQNFTGLNQFDYKAKMPSVKIPILAIFGSGDQFIAPPEGCRAFLGAFQNDENKILYCSKSNGFAEDYNHGRIIHSRNAAKEIYPKVLSWLKNRNI